MSDETKIPRNVRGQITKAYMSGEPITSIAQRFGVSEPYPGMCAKKDGVKLRNPYIPEDVKRRMEAEYREGFSIRKIAKKYGVSHAAVIHSAARAGIPRRNKLSIFRNHTAFVP